MNLISNPWNAVFFVGFVAFLGIRSHYARRTRHNEKVHRQVDGLETFLLILAISTSILFPLIYLFTPLLAFADYRPPALVPSLGLAFMLLALWLFWRSHADLGQNWSATLEIRKQHQLVTSGVYRRIRHPMYAATFLWCIAQALILPNWLAGWSSLATFSLLYLLRTSREEQMMCNFFGDEYRAYMNQTGRLFPRFTKASPQTAPTSN